MRSKLFSCAEVGWGVGRGGHTVIPHQSLCGPHERAATAFIHQFCLPVLGSNLGMGSPVFGLNLDPNGNTAPPPSPTEDASSPAPLLAGGGGNGLAGMLGFDAGGAAVVLEEAAVILVGAPRLGGDALAPLSRCCQKSLVRLKEPESIADASSPPPPDNFIFDALGLRDAL